MLRPNSAAQPRLASVLHAGQRRNGRARPAQQPLRVIVVDDQRFMLDLMSRQLARQRGQYRVIGTCSTAEEAIAACEASQPDLLILDINLPGLSGIDAVPLIRKAAPETRILLCTAFTADEWLPEALRSGADGFVEKTNSWDDFLQAVEQVANGGHYFCTARSAPAKSAGTAPRVALTARETEIVQLIARGLSSKRIASELGVSVDTVSTHRRNVMSKLGMRNVANLVAYAFRSGLVK